METIPSIMMNWRKQDIEAWKRAGRPILRQGHTPAGPSDWTVSALRGLAKLIGAILLLAFLGAVTWIVIKAFLVAFAWAF